LCALSLSKKSYIIVKYWAVEDASPYNLAILRERLCRGRRPRRPKTVFNKKDVPHKKDTHIEVLSHSISDLQSEVLWRFY